MSTIELYRQAAADARAARDAATDDEVRERHDRASAAYFTAANHLVVLPHYTNQATAVRRLRAQLRPLARHAGAEERRERAATEEAYRHMEEMPARHRAEAERWAAQAAEHAAASAASARLERRAKAKAKAEADADAEPAPDDADATRTSATEEQ